MLPLDFEFIGLYLLYFVMGMGLLVGMYFGKTKSWKIHALIYLFYSMIMVWLFSEPQNFQGGSSLLVLFYGVLFPVIHLSIVMV